MAHENAIARYRRWYQTLLRFYPRPYRDRFGESMQQTFNDLCRERARAGGGLFGFVVWVFVETSAGLIRENVRSIMMQNITRRLIVWSAIVALILLVPFLAMQFHWQVLDPGSPALGEVNWSPFDFVFAGVLLFGSALTYELVASKGGTTAYRAAVGVACAAGLLLVWVNAAVGIIGDVDSANVMYFGVIAVGLIGASIARFEPRGMARALVATAVAQALVPLIALTWVSAIDFSPGVAQVFGLNAFFVALWVVSALQFRHAGNTWCKIGGKERPA